MLAGESRTAVSCLKLLQSSRLLTDHRGPVEISDASEKSIVALKAITLFEKWRIPKLKPAGPRVVSRQTEQNTYAVVKDKKKKETQSSVVEAVNCMKHRRQLSRRQTI